MDRWVVMTRDGRYYGGRVRRSVLVVAKLELAVRFDTEDEARRALIRSGIDGLTAKVAW